MKVLEEGKRECGEEDRQKGARRSTPKESNKYKARGITTKTRRKKSNMKVNCL